MDEGYVPKNRTRPSSIAFDKLPLGADSDLSNQAVPIEKGGHLSIRVVIDNGAGGAPTDAPIGVWQLWCSPGTNNVDPSSDSDYEQVVNANLLTALAALASNGNARVSGWVSIRGVPGSYAKLKYVRTSGGSATASGTNGRARVTMTSEKEGLA